MLEEELKKLISENKVIPFVGAGVSMAVRDNEGNKVFRPNAKNKRLKTYSNYGILGIKEGLFTNDCKKVVNTVPNVLLRM